MNWLFKKLMSKLLKDFKTDYEARYELTHDDTMRPDLYWFEKWLNGYFK